jgi:hypothetical protein
MSTLAVPGFFDEISTRDSLRRAIDAYRGHIFPTEVHDAEETARRMIDERGVFLEKQLALAELHASMAQMWVSKSRAESLGGGDRSLFETANLSIECAVRAEASDIDNAIDNARDACKIANTLFLLASRGVEDQFVISRMLTEVQQLIGVVNNYISGAIVQSPPRSFEETLVWLKEQFRQYEDFHLIYPWG